MSKFHRWATKLSTSARIHNLKFLVPYGKGEHVNPPDFISSMNLSGIETWEAFPQKAAAVLVGFFPAPDGWRLLLVRRSRWVGSHKRQVGFPGGYRELEDQSPAATALREFEEELGAKRQSLRVLGTLPVQANIDGIVVVPVLAVADDFPIFSPSLQEVEDVYLPRVAELKAHSTFRFNLFGIWRESDLYQTSVVSIWGLSAKILRSAGFPRD